MFGGSYSGRVVSRGKTSGFCLKMGGSNPSSPTNCSKRNVKQNSMIIEFNIAKDGKHFFATAERSCRDSNKADEVKKVLQEKFPQSEGYEVTASLSPQRGYGIDLSKDMAWEINSILTKL